MVLELLLPLFTFKYSRKSSKIWFNSDSLTHGVCGIMMVYEQMMSGVRGFVFCHGSKSHFESHGATNRPLIESTYKLMTFKQL